MRRHLCHSSKINDSSRVNNFRGRLNPLAVNSSCKQDQKLKMRFQSRLRSPPFLTIGSFVPFLIAMRIDLQVKVRINVNSKANCWPVSFVKFLLQFYQIHLWSFFSSFGCHDKITKNETKGLANYCFYETATIDISLTYRTYILNIIRSGINALWMVDGLTETLVQACIARFAACFRFFI